MNTIDENGQIVDQEIPMVIPPKRDTGKFNILEEIRKLGKQPIPNDNQPILDNPNGAWQYTNYQPMSEAYVPISSTFQKYEHKKSGYEPFVYERPTYESADGILFGGEGEQNKPWENAPVFNGTDAINAIAKNKEEGSIFKPTGAADILFGTKVEPVKEVIPEVPLLAQPIEVPSRDEIISRISMAKSTMPLSVVAPQSPQPSPNNFRPMVGQSNQGKRKAGRPKGSKNKPLPSINTGLNQGQG
jgi:hypothetical protein